MKTLLRKLVVSMFGLVLILPQSMAARKGESGRQNQSGASRGGQFSGTQRQIQRAPQVRNVAPRQEVRQQQAPRQDFRQPVRVAPQPLPNRVQQVPRKVVPKNPSTLPARRNVLPPSAAEKWRRTPARPGRVAVLPERRTILPRTGKVPAPDPRFQAGRVRSNVESRPVARIPRPEVRRLPAVRPGQKTRVTRQPDLNQVAWRPASRSNNLLKTANINRNFRQHANWSTRRHDWGCSPWWNRPRVRSWYGGCWNWGWNRSYYRHHPCYRGSSGGYWFPGYPVLGDGYHAGWGLLGWSLGAMVYDSGYRTYYNPYPVSSVVVSDGTAVSYDEPITRLAVKSTPEDDAEVEEITRASESIIAQSQTAFREKNYLVALEFADRAIAASPGDGALHEYRALVLFALGKYGDAAGVLNPVIASGPGWDWATMVALYDSQGTYADHLKRLEAYTRGNPDAAAPHFLLGYHYMVCGHLPQATAQFELASKIMPSDGVSRELAELTRFSAKDTEVPIPEKDEPPVRAPDPVALEDLIGTWVSTRDTGNSIRLIFTDDGKFTWIHTKDAKRTELTGEYSMNENGLLVLESEDSQMVANVSLPVAGEMKFLLSGGPPADPGLVFKKQ